MKNRHVVFKYLSTAVERDERPPTLIPGWSADISSEDDVTFILLGVSFMLHRNESNRIYPLPEKPIHSDLLAELERIVWREKEKVHRRWAPLLYLFTHCYILALFQILLFPPLAPSFASLLCDENLKKFNSWENKLSENKFETRETSEKIQGKPLLTVETTGRPLSKVLPSPNKSSRSCFLNVPQLRYIS